MSVAPAQEGRGRSAVVLLVDDDADLRSTLGKILRWEAFEVLEAGSAEEAWRVVEGHGGTIDLLLMDVNLPDGFGARLAQALLGPHPEMVVVYITGFAELDPILSGTLNDAAYVLRKPFSREELLTVAFQALPGLGGRGT